MKDEIPFRYFYEIFRRAYNTKAFEIGKEKFGEDFYEYTEIGDCFATLPFSNEERLSLYDQALYETCKTYIQLTNTSIEVEKVENTFAFVKEIVENIKDTPYKESFLWLIEMLYIEYTFWLEKGNLTIMSSSSKKTPPTFQITLNRDNKITQCEMINMEEKEEAKTMLRLLTLERNHQIGPVPNVKYIYRKDI